MTVTKLALYQDALRRAGAERLSAVDEATEVRYKLDDIWDLGAVQYCLRLTKPVFARKTVTSTTATTTAIHGMEYTHTLESDYVVLVGTPDAPTVYSDSNLDEPVRRYLIEDNKLYSEFATIYYRYVKDVSSTFTYWTTDFANVVSGYLAMELAKRIASSEVERLTAEFGELVQISVRMSDLEEPAFRAQKSTTTLSSDWLEIYNDALALMKRPQMTTLYDEREDRIAIDNARDARVVERIFDERGWYFADKVVKIDYNSQLEPVWGFDYAFDLPQDVRTENGVFIDERFHTPLKYYRVQADILYCDAQTIYYQYVADTYLEQPSSWPDMFRGYVAAALAKQAMNQIRDLDPSVPDWVMMEFTRRKHDAESYDGRNRPKTMIRDGSWSRARYGGGFSREHGRR